MQQDQTLVNKNSQIAVLIYPCRSFIQNIFFKIFCLSDFLRLTFWSFKYLKLFGRFLCDFQVTGKVLAKPGPDQMIYNPPPFCLNLKNVFFSVFSILHQTFQPFNSTNPREQINRQRYPRWQHQQQGCQLYLKLFLDIFSPTRCNIVKPGSLY